MKEIQENFTVSARLMAGEEAEVIVDLMAELNPALAVENHNSYWSITGDRTDLVFDMATISEALGHPFRVSGFLTILASYKGEIDVRDDSVVIRLFAPDLNPPCAERAAGENA